MTSFNKEAAVFDWLSRKLLGGAVSAGQLPLDREAQYYLPPGALPARCLDAGAQARQPPIERVRHGGVRPDTDTEMPARSAKVIPLRAAAAGGLDRPKARRPAHAASRKTNP